MDYSILSILNEGGWNLTDCDGQFRRDTKNRSKIERQLYRDYGRKLSDLINAAPKHKRLGVSCMSKKKDRTALVIRLPYTSRKDLNVSMIEVCGNNHKQVANDLGRKVQWVIFDGEGGFNIV